MDYKALYERIIRNRLKHPLENGVYGERHHIKPRSLGGGNHRGNLVKLTAREHFLCHYCLVEMFPADSVERKKMLHAFIIMKAGSIKGNRYVNSRLYAAHKEEYSKQQSTKMKGNGNISAGTCWVNKDRKNKKIKKDELQHFLLDGWVTGRYSIAGQTNQETKQKRQKEFKINAEKKLKENITLYTNYYKIYSEIGYKEFVKVTGWNKSNQNLFNRFKTYVAEYTPSRMHSNITKKSISISLEQNAKIKYGLA